MPNEFHSDIPAAVLKEVQQHLDAARAALAPYLLPLTPKQRKTMLRMGDKTVAFVQKTIELASNNSSFVPDFVNLDELKQDAAGAAALTPARQKLDQLALDTDSTVMQAGSEAFNATLAIYGNIKYLAKNKQPGAQAAYDELKGRFPGNTGGDKKQPPAGK